ncbi:MAG: Gfo/Idh/MocA family oxidoreductase [Clostridia bacterium]|nr:Gfo/Idh/MocA family oxidoreductase [Clostridia bacterium]
MRYALIGCGRVSPNHIKAALDNDLEIAAVCDLLPQAMDGLLSGFGLENVKKYTDYKKMLEEVKPELCAIATDSGKHAAIALDCIGAGCNLIIEKPIAMSMADADRIIDAAEKADVKVCACHQNRFNVAVQQTRRAMEAGRFGKLSHGSIQVRWNRGPEYYAQADWRGKWAQDGGTLMNQCIHGIDLLRWMMGGDAVEVYGATRNRFHPYIEGEDVGMAVVKFKSGAVATIEGTVNIFPDDMEGTLSLFGEKGSVKLGGLASNDVDVWQFSSPEADDDAAKITKETAPNVYGNGHSSLYRDVIEAVRDGREPYVSAKAGRDALEIVLAVYKSQKTGLPVRLPLKDFSSADMEGMFGN